MKSPLFNQKQRKEIRKDSIDGSFFLLQLSVHRLRREVYREKGFIAMKVFEYRFSKALKSSSVLRYAKSI